VKNIYFAESLSFDRQSLSLPSPFQQIQKMEEAERRKRMEQTELERKAWANRDRDPADPLSWKCP
jgi:hypothetical protein